MKTVILKGYYGRDNFGDEIMMELIISYFKNLYPSLQLQVMNSNPCMLEEKYGIKTPVELVTGNYGKKDALKRIATIIRANCYIVGGGTIITDKHSSLHLVEYLIEFGIRRILHRPSIFISVGATEFKHKSTQLICKMLLRCSNLSMIRDSESFALLSKLYSGKSIVKTGDLVLLAFDQNRSTISKKTTFEKKKIGLSLMPYHESLYNRPELDVELAKEFADVADLLAKEGFNVSIIPIQYGYNNDLDYRFSKMVLNMCESNVELFECRNNEEKMRKISTLDCLVSMRLHSLLCAISNNINCIAINHNEKIESCLKVYGIQNQSVTLENIHDIVGKVKEIPAMCDYTEIVAEQRLEAAKNFEFLSKILDKVVGDE